ncbi:MAG: hypothetical protein ABII00_03310 [Elusimicrobiota bacterium]
MSRYAIAATLIAGMILSWPAPAAAKKQADTSTKQTFKPIKKRPPRKPDTETLLLKVEARFRFGELETSAKWDAVDATQSNYVMQRKDQGIALIFNILPVIVEDSDVIDLQFQVEVSEPPRAKKHDTLQFQTEVYLRDGKEAVVLEAPDTRISIKISIHKLE